MNNIINEEGAMMEYIRESITQIVGIRLKAMKASKWMSKQSTELELAANEIEDAIEALSRAETAMGNGHQNLLVSQATLKSIIKDGGKAEYWRNPIDE